MHDLKEKLNPSQLSAVTAGEGPVLVIAGAGSGKTRAIEYRVLHLVQSGVKPGSILLLTFTRRAAHEMLSRASRHDTRCRHVDGGTFHSFAFKTLKRYAKVLGLSNTFTILDEADAEEAIHSRCLELGLFDKNKKFPRKDTLRAIMSMAVNKGFSIAKTLEREYPHFLEMAPQIELLRKEYTAYKIGKSYLDYDDLLIYLKMLLDIPETRRAIADKYRFVMVDEYQDTNTLQGDITCLLASGHTNVMAVGDDAQSIYGFRGASHRNIMEFPKMFKGCRIIKLEENYRSTQKILDTANAVLENMENKYSKCLVSTRKEKGERPKFSFFKNAYDEASAIVETINKLRSDGVDIGSQAVLFRAAYVSIPLQAELGSNGIPFQVFGGLRFYETSHVKDVIAHMKVVMNPRDEIAWRRVLTLIRGIGQKTADKIVREALGAVSLKSIVASVLTDTTKFGRHVVSMSGLRAFLEDCSGKVNPGTLYDMALDYYRPLMKEKFDDWHLRINDLEALRQIAARYESLSQLLADFAIEPPERGVWKVDAEEKRAEKPLTLSTIHSAKGLEWDAVFLIGVTDGVLPSGFSLDDPEQVEEESRLLYVAVTRARDRLFLSMHHEGMRAGITQFNKISRFIDTPNVLASLDTDLAFEGRSGDGIDLDDNDDIIVKYDKDSLLRGVMDYFS
jgi:DNA helicase-2/ATP-dependent DNA helicase PcrA